MRVIRARNVHEALPEAIDLLLREGREEQSRNGPVLVHPEPVTTVYERPRERVVLWPERDANPFFHLYEALWMLGGRNDVASLTRFVKRMSDFSDDGVTFHGAYGRRWRRSFGLDQLRYIAASLAADPSNRRQVLQMWNAPTDLIDQNAKRDVPCNLIAHLQIVFGALDMTVFCRSNDIIWGCYGANAVHFSVLQEYLATRIGVPVGKYWHISNNWHAYPATLEPVKVLADYRAQPPYDAFSRANPYNGFVQPFPLCSTPPEDWYQELVMFLDMEGEAIGYRDPFFRFVALPMMAAHTTYSTLGTPERYEQALALCKGIKATDWQAACQGWIERRYETWKHRNATQ